MKGKKSKAEKRPARQKGAAVGSMEYEKRLHFETLLTDLSARFIHLPVDQVDDAIKDALRRICDCLDIDAATLWQLDADRPETLFLSHSHLPPGAPTLPRAANANETWPWCLDNMRKGKTLVLRRVSDTPAAAARDRELWRQYDVQSALVFPLSAGGGPAFGAANFVVMRAERDWEPAVVARLQLIAQVFANALIRQRAEQSLRESEERLYLATEAAGAGTWMLDAQGTRFWLGPKFADMFGLPPSEVLDVNDFLALVHADDRQRMREKIAHAMQSRDMETIEYRIVRPDGQIRWMHSRGRMCTRSHGSPLRLTGITSDVTSRKEEEIRLQQALDEVQRLRDRLELENVVLREQLRRDDGHDELVGESESILRMLAQAKKVAQTDSAVLILGETGTGKELLAQAIHDMSRRHGKPMIKVNCAALPASLIEGELFGREKGAYTGAMTRQAGRFEVADGSTIFLDEIGDLPLELQVKLLRVLQDGRFERLGSHTTLKADVRVIAATNHDLGAMVREGRFREDLFHRLNVFPIETPPLRSRVADIPLLVWTFLQEFNQKMGKSIDSIPKTVMERLQQYVWPGNVRELRNLVERAVIISEGSTLQIELPASGQGTKVQPATLEEIERKHIADVLERVHWRISGKGGAAEILGLVPTTLHSRLKKLGLFRPKA